jgi:outer membrane receptor for ferrienterochelin and colicins
MTASPHDRLTPAHSMTESATTRRAAFGAVAAPPTALAAAVAAFCGPAGVAEAREHADAGPVTEIVVTASGFEQDVRRAPASISVVGRDELSTTKFRDLAEALRNVEGIDVRGATGKTGGLNVSIRGMPSDYTLFLIDGVRQNAPTEVGQNGFGDALTSFMPPASAIERIEVVRGPMSTLYGSDAMAGVVNIITRPVAHEWTGNVSLEGSVPESGRFGGTARADMYVAGPVVRDRVGISLRANRFHRGDSDRIRPVETANTRDPAPVRSRQHTLGARLEWMPDHRHDVWLDMQQDRTWYDNGDCRLGGFDFVNCNTGAPVATAPGYHDALRFNRDQVSLAHTARLDAGQLSSSLTRNTTAFLGRTIASTARPPGHPDIGRDRTLEATNLLLDSRFVTPVSNSHMLTLGGQIWQAELHDSFLQQPRQDYTAWALLVEDEWQLGADLTATLGLRYDRHEGFGGQLTPRGYLVWNASPVWTVKGGIGRGFKAPQMHFLVDGISEVIRQGQQPNVGNPDLGPEYSINAEIAVLYANAHGLRASATAFQNRIRDKISFRGGNCVQDPIPACAYGQTTEPFVTEYPVNLDEGKSWGLELATGVPLAMRWHLDLTWTLMETELIERGERSGRLSDSARHVGNAQLAWDMTDNARLWLRAEYRGSSRRFDGDPADLSGNDRLEYLALGDLEAYSLLHLGGAYRISPSLTLNANIFNALDKDFTVHRVWVDNAGDPQPGSPYYRTDTWTKGMAHAGRTFWLSLNFAY